jgi:hypothetical protein
MMAIKHPSLSHDELQKKAEGIASSLRSALGYWENNSSALNTKILTQYYFALQLSIAEQVATATPESTLPAIQKHTENGHGLATLRAVETVPDAADVSPVAPATSRPDAPLGDVDASQTVQATSSFEAAPPIEAEFPDNLYVFALKSGHFSSYCRSLGIDLNAYSFAQRPRNWAKVTPEEKHKMITLGSLLRRVPELRPSINECLGVPPLSFHVSHSIKNMSLRAERAQKQMLSTGKFVAPNWGPDPSEGPTSETYVTFATGYGGGEGVTTAFLNGLGLPIKDIAEEIDESSGRIDLVGKYTHPSNEHWWQSLPLHHGTNGTSLIVPFWGSSDPFILHFIILYALSIVVRYLPSLWFEIEYGKLDHLKVLIEEYIVCTDTVLPSLAIERIAGIELHVVPPGSLMAPT